MNYIKAGKWLTVFLTFLGILLFIDLFPKEEHDQKQNQNRSRTTGRHIILRRRINGKMTLKNRSILMASIIISIYITGITQKVTAQNGAMPSQLIWCTGPMKAWRFRNIQTRTVTFGPVPSWWIKRTQPALGKMRLSRL